MKPSDPVEEAARRITAMLVAQMREHPEFPVEWCAYFAASQETFINGDPRAAFRPIGLLNAKAKP